ncbi:MAG: carboxypeptidase-like regulatory domain-containing protein [Flavobacterium sp.]
MLCQGWITAQTTLSGVILDRNTEEPLPGATIYVNGTTLGTISDEFGRFSLELSSMSPSVIFRYVGYESLTLEQPNRFSRVTVKLNELVDSLDEVILEKSLFTHQQKLAAFTREFIGTSVSGLECKILNPEVISLTFVASEKKLKATANKPIKILNPYLGYELEYSLQAFEISFYKVSLSIHEQIQVFHAGTTFFKDISNDNPKFKKRRKNAYIGSTMHWIRSIYNESLKENGFYLLQNGKTISPTKFYSLHQEIDEDSKWIEFAENTPEFTQIFISNERNSKVKVDIPKIQISSLGNYFPPNGLLFLGYMGNQRVGDLLPLDYQP